MADTPSPLANLSFCAKTHSSPQIRCVRAKRSSPGRPSFPSTRHCGAWPGPENIQIPFDRRQCGQPFQTSWTLDLKRLLRSGALFKKFSNAGRWKGHSVCKWSRGASSWAQSLKRWKNTTQTFDATGWVLTETRRSWKDWTAPLLSGCSDQYAFEIRLPEGLLPRGPSVVSALNGEVTRLTGKKPAEATKEKAVYSKTCDFLPQTCRDERKTAPLCGGWSHLYKPDELEGERKVYHIEKPITKPNEPILYYLYNGHKRGFVREELLVVPANTELPLHL